MFFCSSWTEKSTPVSVLYNFLRITAGLQWNLKIPSRGTDLCQRVTKLRLETTMTITVNQMENHTENEWRRSLYTVGICIGSVGIISQADRQVDMLESSSGARSLRWLPGLHSTFLGCPPGPYICCTNRDTALKAVARWLKRKLLLPTSSHPRIRTEAWMNDC